ncbi:MAG: right-handed parallel beta-helix repeat-containing protein [Armatimonadota bacterium]
MILEDIIKIKDNYIVIAEPFRPKDRLIVLTTPDTELRLGQVIDCSGTLTTLSSGERALQNVTVRGYASENGELLYHPNIIKAFPGAAQQTWPWKTDLTVYYVESGTASSASTSDSSEVPNSDPAEGPTFYSKISDTDTSTSTSVQTQGVHTQSYYSNIPGLKTSASIGDPVELQCKQILAVGTETINSVTYNYVDIAEDSSITDSIRCYYSDGSPTTSDRINKVTGQVQYTTEMVICVDDGPDYNPQILVGRLSIVNSNTIPYVLSQADGASASLTGKVVTANQTDFPGSIYIQEPSSSGSFGGIRVSYSGSTIARGSLVSVTGTVALDSDGERKISSASVTVTDTGTVPGALGMPNKILGGGEFNVNTPGVDYPTDSGTGLYNKGLLVKSWGRITAVDATNKFFYINDGTGFEDGSGNTGVKVSWDWATSGKADIIAPSVGWYVSVAGISSSETDASSNVIRVLRLRSYDDILAFDPEDTADPTVAITSPTGTNWHVASGATSITVSGTATDSVAGIAIVEFKVGSGNWNAATYNSTTHTWSYDWQSPASAMITVRATDYAGNTAEVSEAVTIISVNVIYVSTSGSNGAGTSWATAKTTITAGMSAASSGKEIWVAEDTYTGCITLTSGVALYGGFSGSETAREQRDWDVNQTIIDANAAGHAVSITGTSNSLTRIDGFTVKNGSSNYGGGIYCTVAATIANNNIHSNTGNSSGGGIYCTGAAAISDNLIYSNITNNYVGGGIYCSATANISHNVITDNTAKTVGGGIYCTAVASLLNNIIKNNNATTLGGGIYVSGQAPILVSNVIMGNNATKGAGIYYATSQSGQITNNTIAYNANTSSTTNNYGGGIYLDSSATSAMINNIVVFNIGGGIYGPSTLTYTKNLCYSNSVSNYSWNTITTYHPDNDLAPVDPGIPYIEYGDWHIADDSLCKDNGASASNLPSVDIDGDCRIYDDPNVAYDIIDIGADEWSGTNPANPEIIIYVQPNGNDNNDGSSWVNAVASVQRGIDLAAFAGGGEVWVAEGTYDAISLKSFVKVYGGFAVGAEDKSNRIYETVLDGNSATSVVTIVSAPASKIDGFTIQNGLCANGGGGVLCKSSATISNNKICFNKTYGSGGGIYCTTSDYVNITNNDIYSNSSSGSGGGICCVISAMISKNNIYLNNANSGAGISYSGLGIISDNDIYSNFNNSSSGKGGGIACSGNATIYGNKICSNYGSYGAGIYCSASASITNNFINANSGFGVYASSASSILVDAVGNVIKANRGAGIYYVQNAAGQVANNTIIYNVNTDTSSGGGVYIGSTSTPTFTNNIIAFNTGYGIDASSEPTCMNNILYDNTANYSWNIFSIYHPDNDLPPGDPGIPYAEYGDWHIAVDSSCRDTGASLSALPDNDMDGDIRQNDNVDIGADECNGNAPDNPLENPTVIYVKTNGDDSFSGRSWSDAVANVQRGIELASLTSGAEVWVAEGTYGTYGTYTIANGTIYTYTYVANLKSFVKVYGGFEVGCNYRSDRNWKTHPTVLLGGGEGSVVRINSVASCLIDGFLITNGCSGNGGGIYCNDASATILHNIIYANSAYDNGGGIYCNAFTGSIIGNSIVDNTSVDGAGIYCTESNVDVINCTVAYNTLTALGICGGIRLDESIVNMINSIIAENSGTGVYDYSSNTKYRCNDIWGHTTNYYSNLGYTDPTGTNGNISLDPLLDSTDHIHISSDTNGNDCKDKGFNDVVADDDFDIDLDYRIQDGTVDIGADEIAGCVWDVIEFSPAYVLSELQSQVTTKVHIYNPLTGQPIANQHVDFEITTGTGSILSILGNGNSQIDNPDTSGYGETNTNGDIQITVVRSEGVSLTLTASTSTCSGSAQISANAIIHSDSRVGLLYCFNESHIGFVDAYLQREAIVHPSDINYSQIDAMKRHWSDPYDVILLVMPESRFVTKRNIEELKRFVHSGRNKRVVLVGEWNPAYSSDNESLNKVAYCLGMNSRFNIYNHYDYYNDRDTKCNVNSNHYLTDGVNYLWDQLTSCFVSDGEHDWSLWARPIAYVYDSAASDKPWIIEEDTATAGSIVAFHDTNIFLAAYNDTYDTIPEANFRFIYNLCTKFPE